MNWTIEIYSHNLGWVEAHSFNSSKEQATLLLASFKNQWPDREFRLK